MIKAAHKSRKILEVGGNLQFKKMTKLPELFNLLYYSFVISIMLLTHEHSLMSIKTVGYVDMHT